MARKKPARTAKKAKKQARKKSAARPAARKSARKSSAKSARKAAKKAPGKKAAKPARKPARKPAPKPKAAARPKAAAKPKKRGSLLASAAAAAVGSALAAGVKAAMGAGKKPNLDRPRKTVADVHGIPSSLDLDRTASAARTGRAELKERLAKNTSASPALTSGDVDADWESAESVGDEAPGGDNPTPDQDVVDDIGRALGVEYDDDEELQGGAEIADRDRNRWELDPSSKDDFDDEER
jgi:hypothetical protein